MADSFHEEEILGKAYDARLMRRLLTYLRPYRRVVSLALIAIFFYGLLQAVPPYLMKVEIDRYLDPTKHHQIPQILARFLSTDPYVGILQIALEIFVPAVLLTFVLQFAQTFAMQLVGQKVMYDLRKQVFEHLQHLQMSYFDRNPVGRLVTRVTTDIDVLNDMFASGVVAVFGDFFTLLSIMVVMLKLDWRLSLLTFAVLPLIILVTGLFRRSVRESYRRIRLAIARINAYLQEHITGMSVLQLFNREEKSFEEFEQINGAYLKAYMDSILAYGLFYPTVEFLGVLAIVIILYKGGGMILGGSLTVGTAIAFIQYSQRFFRPIQDLSDKYNILQAAMASSERVFRLLDTPVKISDSAQPTRVAEARGRVEFRNVGFAYQDDHRVLENVSFTIEPGETVAVVGHTGAGKTTLTNLLLRFYDVQEGAIFFDGVNIRDISLHDLRSNFGIVLQDPFLFSGTIASNVRLGTEGISDQQVRDAVRRVNMLGFIESLPGGFDEPVKERGATLSSGQKQLLSFARALAHDPKILILDEATSSVDPETDHMIREGLRRLLENRTSLVIAHRLSTIQNASKIIVMHKGRVREVGTHQELLRLQGIYFKLYQLQYKDQELLTSAGSAKGPCPEILS
ncbi:MAG TPA: ABC transporter ATP-binding protein [Terriglobia bacterium]|nr:ABC transporter ATP-binding protein [Terriglobia bacterium]